MSRIFSADEDRLIIGKKAYGNFRICLEGQFKDAYSQADLDSYLKILDDPNVILNDERKLPSFVSKAFLKYSWIQ